MNPDSAVRVMVTRGEGPIGLDPGLCPRPNRIVFVRPFAPLVPESYSAGVHLIVARTFRNSPRALDPEIKSGNFLNNILAQREAIAAGAFEAVLLSQDGLLTEATQSNLFLVAEGVVRTPHPRAGLLRGVTRAVVLELCRTGGMASAEEDLFVTSLYDAAEVFLTSTLKGIVPVTSIGQSRRPVGEGTARSADRAAAIALRSGGGPLRWRGLATRTAPRRCPRDRRRWLGRRLLRQPRHRHDVAADRDDEAGAGDEARSSTWSVKPDGRPRARIVGKRVLGLGDADGQIAEALLLDARQRLARRRLEIDRRRRRRAGAR